MCNRGRFTAVALAVSMSSLMLAQAAFADNMETAFNDSGSAAFNRYVQDIHGRMQAIESSSYWVSTQVDGNAIHFYLSALSKSDGEPGMNDTATYLASVSPSVSPLRTFNSYLTYLGKLMRVDAGPPGPLLENDRGTQSFDRYIEEINYRIQMKYEAEDTF